MPTISRSEEPLSWNTLRRDFPDQSAKLAPFKSLVDAGRYYSFTIPGDDLLAIIAALIHGRHKISNTPDNPQGEQAVDRLDHLLRQFFLRIKEQSNDPQI